MKSILYGFIAIILISLLVEIFVPTKHMKKAVYIALSLTTLVVLASGIKGAFKTGGSASLELNINESAEALLSSSVESTKLQIIQVLTDNQIEVVNLKIDYSIENLALKVESVDVQIEDEKNKEKASEIVVNFLNVQKEQVKIWAKS